MEKLSDRFKTGSNLLLSMCCHLLVILCNLVSCIQLLCHSYWRNRGSAGTLLCDCLDCCISSKWHRDEKITGQLYEQILFQALNKHWIGVGGSEGPLWWECTFRNSSPISWFSFFTLIRRWRQGVTSGTVCSVYTDVIQFHPKWELLSSKPGCFNSCSTVLCLHLFGHKPQCPKSSLQELTLLNTPKECDYIRF